MWPHKPTKVTAKRNTSVDRVHRNVVRHAEHNEFKGTQFLDPQLIMKINLSRVLRLGFSFPNLSFHNLYKELQIFSRKTFFSLL